MKIAYNLLVLTLLFWNFCLACTGIVRSALFRSWSAGQLLFLFYGLCLFYLLALLGLVQLVDSDFGNYNFGFNFFSAPIVVLLIAAIVTEGFDGLMASSRRPQHIEALPGGSTEPKDSAPKPTPAPPPKPKTRPLRTYEEKAACIGDLIKGMCSDESLPSNPVIECKLSYEWSGLSDLLPCRHRHHLFLVDGKYVGASYFRIARLERSVEAAVDPALFARFVDMLLSCPIELGGYTPAFKYTDSYPAYDLILTIATTRQTGGPDGKHAVVGTTHLHLRSESQEDFPWEVEIEGVKWTVPTGGPSNAIKELRDSLNFKIIDALREQAMEALRTERQIH